MSLEERFLLLEKVVAAQAERIQVLEAANAELEARNKELLARLGQTSNNSHQPPSSDKPGTNRDRTKPTGRKRGGQPGHEGAVRQRLKADKVVDHWPDTCGKCDRKLSAGESTPDSKWCQVVELPEVRAHVTEHRAHASRCACGAVTVATLPSDALLHGFGPRLCAFIAYLTGRCRLSKRQVVELLEDALGTSISVGAVCAVEQDVSEALAAPVEEARAAVRRQPVVHADETGWREDKQRAWLWVAVTSVAVVFRVARSRGAVVAKDLLGELFSGRLVTDRWSAYNWVKDTMRQLCWSHLIRDMRGMVDRGGIGGELGAKMLVEVDKMMEWWALVRDGPLTRAEFQSNMVPVRAEVERLLADAAARAEKKTSGMCAEILKLKAALWTFIDIEGVGPTNNAAERSIRPAVLWRKGSFGTDSANGSRFAERILTTVATVRLRRGNVLRYLTEACASYRSTRSAPSLLTVAPCE